MLALDQIATLYGKPMALLIQCCRVHFKTDTLESLNQRLEDLEADKIEEIVKRVQLLSRLHRIRPVVYRVLLNANVSEQIKTNLKNELHSITLQNFEIAKETERIVQKLVIAGVTAIPYKGVAYSKQFYRDISMRESSDIDLVIDPNNIDAIINLMQADDYKVDGIEGLQRVNRENFIKQQKDLCFDKNKSFHVEFHWKITHPNFCIPTSINHFANNNSTKLSNNEHLRAVILHHWIQDGYTYLKTLIDVAQAIYNQPTSLNFKTINANTYFGFTVASKCVYELFGIEIDLKSTIEIADNRAKQILQYNLHSKHGKNKKNEAIALVKQYHTSYKNQISFIESFYRKVTFTFQFWGGLLKPKHSDYSLTGIPRALSILYFFVRANRMLKRIFKRAKR